MKLRPNVDDCCPCGWPKAGADVEARDNEGKTPAEHAAESMPVRHAVLEVLGQS